MIVIIKMIIELTFLMKRTGSRSCDLPNSRNGVTTVLGRNVDLFEFSGFWQLFLHNSSN